MGYNLVCYSSVTGEASGYYRLLGKYLVNVNAEVVQLSAGTDALEERLNILMESIDWLSAENEGQKLEIERLRAFEKDADTLLNDYVTVKDRFDKMKTRHGRMRASFLELLVSVDNLLALRSEMAAVTAERDILKIENEVMALENCKLREQLESTRDAEQRVKKQMKVLNKTAQLLSYENEILKKELEEASLKEFEALVLRIEYNGIRIKLEEMIKDRDRKQVKICL
jgi:predicted  nucleic acid-binding Zn-ribbon protein